METILRSKNEKMRRYVVFFVGLFIMSFGVSLVTCSLLGTSPIYSVPYVWSLHIPPKPWYSLSSLSIVGKIYLM